jgi:hypothetical protein
MHSTHLAQEDGHPATAVWWRENWCLHVYSSEILLRITQFCYWGKNGLTEINEKQGLKWNECRLMLVNIGSNGNEDENFGIIIIIIIIIIIRGRNGVAVCWFNSLIANYDDGTSTRIQP